MIKTIIHDFQASCDIAFKVARERGTIVAGGIVQSGVFKHVKVFGIFYLVFGIWYLVFIIWYSFGNWYLVLGICRRVELCSLVLRWPTVRSKHGS